MSHFSPKAMPSSRPSPYPSTPEFAQLAVSLQAACDALRSFDEDSAPALPVPEAGEIRAIIFRHLSYNMKKNF